MVLSCTLFQPYSQRVPISRKAGENRTMYSDASLKLSNEVGHVVDANRAISEISYSHVRPEHFKTPDKRGVMSKRDDLKKVSVPLKFLAQTTNQSQLYTVTPEQTQAHYVPPYRQPHSEAAIIHKPKVLGRTHCLSTNHLDFGKYGDLPENRTRATTADLNAGNTVSGFYKSGYLGHRPRSENNREMVKKLSRYGASETTSKVDVQANLHRNMPGYTGFQPTDRGPFRPGPESTSARANFEGLGQLV